MSFIDKIYAIIMFLTIFGLMAVAWTSLEKDKEIKQLEIELQIEQSKVNTLEDALLIRDSTLLIYYDEVKRMQLIMDNEPTGKITYNDKVYWKGTQQLNKHKFKAEQSILDGWFKKD